MSGHASRFALDGPRNRSRRRSSMQANNAPDVPIAWPINEAVSLSVSRWCLLPRGLVQWSKDSFPHYSLFFLQYSHIAGGCRAPQRFPRTSYWLEHSCCGLDDFCLRPRLRLREDFWGCLDSVGMGLADGDTVVSRLGRSKQRSHRLPLRLSRLYRNNSAVHCCPSVGGSNIGKLPDPPIA